MNNKDKYGEILIKITEDMKLWRGIIIHKYKAHVRNEYMVVKGLREKAKSY